MLGRQQIAGVPTAISELFKNAHDAYADRVEVDFFRWNQLFVLRDDGVGMTQSDFEERWLTLGTESKIGAGSLAPPPPMPGKPLRPMLGEKGIGRLAIAVIGPQVLVMTRSHTPNSPLVCAFINWTLFESPGVRLDQVEIPLLEYRDAELPGVSDIELLLDVTRTNIEELGSVLTAAQRDSVITQLDQFSQVDPQRLDGELGEPSLRSGSGTHFLILPVDESLLLTLDESRDRGGPSAIRKTLVGFTNTMTTEATSVIESRFRDHKTRDSYDEIIGAGAFFTPEEFAEADHHILGRFDDYGQFVGEVTVYGRDAVPHVVPWTQAGGRRTDCGPFSIRVAVVQGVRTESRVPPDEWSKLTNKLEQIGGLYVYRDGVRVLPYGGPDNDWVGIEYRRTKSASYYFFSYRRIFGNIDIDSQHNWRLNEKAGREGFRENRAYRQFRDILENFFIQIAADFFREGGAEAAAFQEVRVELERDAAIRRRHDQQARARRARFERALGESVDAIASGDVAEAAQGILGTLKKDLASAAALRNPSDAATRFIEAETRARTQLIELRERFRPRGPRGFGMPKALRREWQAFQAAWEDVERDTVAPAFEEIERIVASEAETHLLAVDRRRRFEEALRLTATEARRETQTTANDAVAALRDVQTRVSELRRVSLSDLEKTIAEIEAEIARLDLDDLTDEAFVETRNSLEERIVEVAEVEKTSLGTVALQLRSVAVDSDGEGPISPLELAGALDEEIVALRERADEELELAQLGMALSVISHEFDTSIRAVRSNLRRLRSWADANESLRSLYEGLRTSFDHLDGYLTLFTPLQRRLFRKEVEIVGAEIDTFLRDLFAERMVRDEVSLEVTPRFKRYKFKGYPSTFYPVFVNLVDNALYWVAQAPDPRVITIDEEAGVIRVSDSGPGVLDRDHEAIFEQGFTRKPGGRGLGLYISRDVLRRDGYDLEVAPAEPGKRGTFLIRPVSQQTTEEEE
jgi:signal transduction histidine kinase